MFTTITPSSANDLASRFATAHRSWNLCLCMIGDWFMWISLFLCSHLIVFRTFYWFCGNFWEFCGRNVSELNWTCAIVLLCYRCIEFKRLIHCTGPMSHIHRIHCILRVNFLCLYWEFVEALNFMLMSAEKLVRKTRIVCIAYGRIAYFISFGNRAALQRKLEQYWSLGTQYPNIIDQLFLST